MTAIDPTNQNNSTQSKDKQDPNIAGLNGETNTSTGAVVELTSQEQAKAIIDKDGNGVISQQEMQDRAMAIIDTDGDGIISVTEARDALAEYRLERYRSDDTDNDDFVSKFDFNVDGKLQGGSKGDRAIIQAVINEHGEEKLNVNRELGRLKKIVRKYDRDRDNQIDNEEAAKLYQDLVDQKDKLKKEDYQMLAGSLLRTNEAFSKIDSDKDGKVDATDFKKAAIQAFLSADEDINDLISLGKAMGFNNDQEIESTKKALKLLNPNLDGGVKFDNYRKTYTQMYLSSISQKGDGSNVNPEHDLNGDGIVSREDLDMLQEVTQLLGLPVNEQHATNIRNFVDLIDEDSDGAIDSQDFNKAFVNAYLSYRAKLHDHPENIDLKYDVVNNDDQVTLFGDVLHIAHMGSLLDLVDPKTDIQALINAVDITDVNKDGVISKPELLESIVEMGKQWDNAIKNEDPNNEPIPIDPKFDLNSHEEAFQGVEALDVWTHYFMSQAVSDISEDNYNDISFNAPYMPNIGYGDTDAVTPDEMDLSSFETEEENKAIELMNVNNDDKISFREAFEAYMAMEQGMEYDISFDDNWNIIFVPRYEEKLDLNGNGVLDSDGEGSDQKILKDIIQIITGLNATDLDDLADNAFYMNDYFDQFISS